AARAQVAALDPDQPVYDVATMEDRLARSVAPARFHTGLLAAFALVAVALAAIGLYGLLALLLAPRTHEIGIRGARGARRADVFRLVAGETLRLTVAGAALGLAGALALTRLLGGLLYAVSPTDPLTFAAMALLFAAVALAASWVPARRAMRMDP